MKDLQANEELIRSRGRVGNRFVQPLAQLDRAYLDQLDLASVLIGDTFELVDARTCC